MWPNPQETADLVTFTEKTVNGKLNSFVQRRKLSLHKTLRGRPGWYPNDCFDTEYETSLIGA